MCETFVHCHGQTHKIGSKTCHLTFSFFFSTHKFDIYSRTKKNSILFDIYIRYCCSITFLFQALSVQIIDSIKLKLFCRHFLFSKLVFAQFFIVKLANVAIFNTSSSWPSKLPAQTQLTLQFLYKKLDKDSCWISWIMDIKSS